jgi:hypothetical protein
VNRFNLTFRGNILPGHDPERARARLGELLEISDPAALQQLYSGELVVLRRNLERKAAAELYAKLHRIGIQAELVKIEGRVALHAEPAVRQAPADAAEPEPAQTTQSAPTPDPTTSTKPVPTPPTDSPKHSLPTVEHVVRRADLAADHVLAADEAAELQAKEEALAQALREKEKARQAPQSKKTASARSSASQRARERTLAREAAHVAKVEAARKKAEQAESQRQAEAALAARKAEQQRLKQEEAARLAAERERVEAAERAAREAERAHAAAQERERVAKEQRLAKEKAAQHAEQQRREEQQAARAQVEIARRKREQAAAVAQRKAEELRKRAAEQARKEEEQREREALEERAINRGAAQLNQLGATAKAGNGRVKTRLDLPSQKRPGGQAADEGRRRRQPGEPNLYSLRPFRNTPEVKARAALAQRRMRLAMVAAFVALVCALITLPRLLTPEPARPNAGADALVVTPQQRPLLLSGESLLLHDRSGVGEKALPIRELGLAKLLPPMAFDNAGNLLALGSFAPEPGQAGIADPALLRCDLLEPFCQPVSDALAGVTVSGLAVHPLDGSVFIADSVAQQLLKVSAAGKIVARANVALPPSPILRLDSGLLLINSAAGSGVSVFRYEDDAFGNQLDELLILPNTANNDQESGEVKDFLKLADNWWVILSNPADVQAGLYRFDQDWQLVEQAPQPAGSSPAELAAWGNKLLVRDEKRLALQRYSASGAVEAPLVSSLLSNLVQEQQRLEGLTRLSWRVALAVFTLVLIAAVVTAFLNRARGLVYKSCRERGAEPIDKLGNEVTWVDPAPDRQARLARNASAYWVLAAGCILSAIGIGVSALQLTALLLLLAGPAIALALMQRSEAGHIGTAGAQLLLVDHAGMYHLGSDSRVHYRGSFLMIDDVVVFLGNRWFPAFDPEQTLQQIAPLAQHGVQVDRKILTVRLLQGRHPIALGAIAISTGLAAAIALLSLQGVA